MTDISLVWFAVSDGTVPADRHQVREAAKTAGLAPDLLSRESRVHAFVRACQTRTTYTDEDAHTWTLRAGESKRSSEFITYQVKRDDGYTVAEYKFFQARRTRAGVVQGSHVLRSVLRARLSPATTTAARAWIQAADAKFESVQQEAPLYAVRRICRASILEHAVPIRGRESTYFVYGDQIEYTHRVRSFLRAICTDPDFTQVDVDDNSDYTPFARSADEYWGARAELLNGRMASALRSGPALSKLRLSKWDTTTGEVREQADRHERRLRQELTRTRSALLVTDRLVSEIAVRTACRQSSTDDTLPPWRESMTTS